MATHNRKRMANDGLSLKEKAEPPAMGITSPGRVSELVVHYGVHPSYFCRWKKQFLGVGKRHLSRSVSSKEKIFAQELSKPRELEGSLHAENAFPKTLVRRTGLKRTM